LLPDTSLHLWSEASSITGHVLFGRLPVDLCVVGP
jgi:hypothetical protein